MVLARRDSAAAALAPPVLAPQAEAVARAGQAMRERRYGEADGICRDILRASPDCAPALGLRGTIAALEGNTAAAIGLLERACAGDPANAGWQTTLGELYRITHRLDGAVARAQEAVRLRPRDANTLVNLAKVYVDLADGDQAVRVFLSALAVDPDNASAHLGLGQVLLARGHFRPGWIEYEWRNKLEQAQGRLPAMRAPQWNGMRLAADRVLLIGDQGFGDTLQFTRYIPIVAERCGEVLLACGKELQNLLAKVSGVGRTFHQWQDVPGFTAYALLSSLPYVFGTELTTIPEGGAYITADPERVAAWRSRLGTLIAPGLRVGVVWAGRPDHPNDARRSVPLKTFLPLANIPGVALVSLQKDVPTRDKPVFAAMRMLDVSDGLTDFAEAAAAIQNLDLVVTVDSAVAHLAGAMERTVWMLTATPADWRWLLERSDTPWYRSMRLFRQTRPGEWGSVVGELTEALTSLAARPG